MELKKVKFSIRHTVNLGNYQSLSVEAEQEWEIQDSGNVKEEMKKALPSIKGGLIRQLEELSDSFMIGKIKGLDAEIQEEWQKSVKG